MKVTLDKILSERVEELAADLGISVSDLLTKSINSFINVHHLKNQGFRHITAESDHESGDISGYFFDEITESASRNHENYQRH